MTNDKLLEYLAARLAKINDEMGRLGEDASKTQADVEWLKGRVTRLEYELWGLLVLVFGALLAYIFK